MRALRNIAHLGLKELISLRYDYVLVVLILYSFTVMVYVTATGTGIEVKNASVAVVDEDGSALSRRLTDALRPPYFQTPQPIGIPDIDPAMDRGRHTFVIDIPPRFEADLLAGRAAQIQINVDATAMSQAGVGSAYVRTLFSEEIRRWQHERGLTPNAGPPPIAAVPRALFNPNLYSEWFLGTMMIVNVITLLSLILSGAALIREREKGTLEHLLVMPLTPFEIMAAKIWANGVVILGAACLSMLFVVGKLIGTPLNGSLPLFLTGAALYLFAMTSLGIVLATLARSMPQLGLLAIPVIFPMIALSGNTTPLESMPEAIQRIMLFSPSTHFVKLAQATVYRGAGLDVVWPQLCIIAGMGLGFFSFALLRLRRSLTVMAG